MGAKVRFTVPILAGLMLVVAPNLALGTAVPASANIIQVTATSAGHTSTFEAVFPVTEFDGRLTWGLQAPIAIMDGDFSMGTIDRLSVIYNADPQVDLEFAVTNGNLAASTVFDITAATIVFTAVPNAEAAALASVSLTQGAGSPAGVSASGLFAGDKMYEARYSTHPVANTHTVFADLVSGFSAAFGDTRTEGLPEIGMVALGTTVYMMESEFKFSLSAGDQASGTSVFLITPEPASLVLMGLASALLFRNRRGG